MKITSPEIRRHLKQYDSYFGHRPSQTKALLDPEYDVIPDNEIMYWSDRSAQCVVNFFKSKDPIQFDDLTKNTLYKIYKEVGSDCEDITGWSLAFFQMLWRLAGNLRNPAAFRIIINNKYGLHALGWIKTDLCWRYFEFQNLSIIPNQRILAVT